jgi:hypothetical protein
VDIEDDRNNREMFIFCKWTEGGAGFSFAESSSLRVLLLFVDRAKLPHRDGKLLRAADKLGENVDIEDDRNNSELFIFCKWTEVGADFPFAESSSLGVLLLFIDRAHGLLCVCSSSWTSPDRVSLGCFEFAGDFDFGE